MDFLFFQKFYFRAFENCTSAKILQGRGYKALFFFARLTEVDTGHVMHPELQGLKVCCHIFYDNWVLSKLYPTFNLFASGWNFVYSLIPFQSKSQVVTLRVTLHCNEFAQWKIWFKRGKLFSFEEKLWCFISIFVWRELIMRTFLSWKRDCRFSLKTNSHHLKYTERNLKNVALIKHATVT